MSNVPSNSDDIIDSRDVIERLADLGSWNDCQVCGEKVDLGKTRWIHSHSDDIHCGTGDGATATPTILNEDECAEMHALRKLAEEASGYAADWEYGETLIRDSYFVTYAQEMAEEIGAVNPDAGWPNSYIDWERAAEALQMDYTSVDFDGVTYWIR
jgi:antirestriction protein